MRERDERLVAQRGEPHRAARSQRVLGVDSEHRRLARHDPRLELRRRLGARAHPDERGVQLARRQRGEQRIGLVLHQGQVDPRVPAREGPERAYHAPVGQGLDEADRERPGEEPAQRRDGLAPVLDLRERGARVWQQRRAGRGQGHRAAVAQKHPLTELGLEPPDLLADRGLRDSEPLGGTGEVRLVGHRDEIRELPELHRS